MSSIECRDGGDGVQIEPVDEHAQSPENALFVGVEEVVGPVERGFKCALAAAASSTGKELEAIVKTGEEFNGAHDGDAGGGELDGEGHAIKPAADRTDGRGVVVGECELGVHGGGPVDKEAYSG